LKIRARIERQSHSYDLAQTSHVKRRDGAFSSAKYVRDIHGKKGYPVQVGYCGSGPCRTCCSRDRKAEGINADGPPTAPWGCGSQAAPNLPSFNFGSCARTKKVNTDCFFVWRQIYKHRRVAEQSRRQIAVQGLQNEPVESDAVLQGSSDEGSFQIAFSFQPVRNI
jgi:hypothetical protein